MVKNEQKKLEKIYYFSSTHWDREWYKTFQGFRARLIETIDGVIETLERNKEFSHFTLDGQTAVLDDYLEIKPENRERLKNLIKEGRISIGPWYTQPDEFLVSGESLINNLLLGHLKSKEFDTEAMKFGYVPDIFGHIAQLPQIFNGFGIKSALLGRGVNEYNCPAFFNWESPDKSICPTYKTSEVLGYGSFIAVLYDFLNGGSTTIEEAFKLACSHIEEEIGRTHLPYVVLMDGLDHQPIHEKGAEIAKLLSEHYNCPVVFDSLEELFKDIESYFPELKVISGELNETGKGHGLRGKKGFSYEIRHTLSSRYDLKKANDITQNILEKWMLPVSAVASLKGEQIPSRFQDIAYRYLIQNHAHDSICGCSIDEVHQDMHYRYRQSNQIAEEVINRALLELMDIKINKLLYKPELDKPHFLRIYNPLFYERNETITVDIEFSSDYPLKFNDGVMKDYSINAFCIMDNDDNQIPYQIIDIKNKSAISTLKDIYNKKADIYTVTFSAKLPACGYAQYLIAQSEFPTRYLHKMEKETLCAENKFVVLNINDNGTFNIYDKKSKKTYQNLNSFTDNSEIGDGWCHVPLINDSISYSNGACKRIEKVSDGPCSVTFKITTVFEIPKSTATNPLRSKRSDEYVKMYVETYVTLSQHNRWVDVETIINNNAFDHRIKVLFPTGIDSEEYYASQAFTFIKRKTGSNLDTGEWKEFDKPENNFEGIALKKDKKGRGIAFISAYGLHECEAKTDKQGTLAITLLRSFSRTVFTNGQSDGQIQGINQFKYRLCTFSEDDSFADIVKIKDKLCTGIKFADIYYESDKAVQELKNQKSFYFDSKNIVISAIRNSISGNNSIIIRVYNCSDKDAEGELFCPIKISSVFEIDMLENTLSKVDCTANSVVFKASPWKIKTYKISFEK